MTCSVLPPSGTTCSGHWSRAGAARELARVRSRGLAPPGRGGRAGAGVWRVSWGPPRVWDGVARVTCSRGSAWASGGLHFWLPGEEELTPPPPPPAVTNRGLLAQYPLREGLYLHAGLSQYRAVTISGSNLQITGVRSGLRVLAAVGSAFLLKQSPAPGARPAWRG